MGYLMTPDKVYMRCLFVCACRDRHRVLVEIKSGFPPIKLLEWPWSHVNIENHKYYKLTFGQCTVPLLDHILRIRKYKHAKHDVHEVHLSIILI